MLFVKDGDWYWEISTVADTPEQLDRNEDYIVRNALGGFHYKTITDKDEVIESTWEHIYQTAPSVRKYTPKHPHGWLAPDGSWYACDSYEHENFAWIAFHKNGDELCKNGWIRVVNDWEGDLSYITKTKLTDVQIQVLNERNIPIREWDRPV